MTGLSKVGRVYLLDGQRVPSVTDIISIAIDDLGHLNPAMLKKAAQRGTEVHTFTELYDQGTLDWSTVPDTRIGYLDAYEKFIEDTGWEPVAIEEFVANRRYRYAGTVDRRGFLRKLHNDKVVLDIKSGPLQPTVALQLAGYGACYEEPLRRYAVRLSAEGEYELREYADAADRGVFLSAAAVAHWKLRNGKAKLKAA